MGQKIFNLLVEKSVFPDECKIAKLKPLYKKGSKLEPKNYKKSRNHLQGLIKRKKCNFVSQKLTENISKPREL